MGYGLIDAGRQTKNNAMSSFDALAQQQRERDAVNKQIEAQKDSKKASAIGTGVSVGMMAGGPMGAVVGGAIGLFAGDLF